MPGQDAARDSWRSLLPDNDPQLVRTLSRTSSASSAHSHSHSHDSPSAPPAYQMPPAHHAAHPHPHAPQYEHAASPLPPPPARASVASSTSAITALSLGPAERRLSSASQFSARTQHSIRSQLSTLSSDSACSTAPIAESPENMLGLDFEQGQDHEPDRDNTSSRSAPPNIPPRQCTGFSPTSPQGGYERARALGQAGTPQQQPQAAPRARPSSTRSWNGQEGEPEYLVRHSPAPTTPFLERRPAPPETKLDVESHQNGYTVRLNLPGFTLDGISLSVKRNRILHIVADKWDAETGGHFEPSILFAADADLHHVRAAFDGTLLLIEIPLKSRRSASATTHRSSTLTSLSESARNSGSPAPVLAHPRPTMAQTPLSPVTGLSQSYAQHPSTTTTTSSSSSSPRSESSTSTTAPAKQPSPSLPCGTTPVPAGGVSCAHTEALPPTKHP